MILIEWSLSLKKSGQFSYLDRQYVDRHLRQCPLCKDDSKLFHIENKYLRHLYPDDRSISLLPP